MAFGIHLSPRKPKTWIPECDDTIKSYVGNQFNSLVQGIDFYRTYAQEAGFDVRMNTQRKVDDIIVSKNVTCSKEGDMYPKGSVINEDGVQTRKRNRLSIRVGCKAMISFKFCDSKYKISTFHEAHNHLLTTSSEFQYMKSNRNLTAAHKKFIHDLRKANLGASKAFSVYSQLSGGKEYVGASKTDFKNYQRDLKVFIGDRDAQMTINEFFTKQEFSEDFYFKFNHDEEKRLTRLFWCDMTARKNYELYGDSVSFDATYGTNRYMMVFTPFTGIDNNKKSVTFAADLIAKEDTESFVWLFNNFLEAMNKKQPKLFVTDQDLGMKKAIEQVFTQSRHRLCMWHITHKLSIKVPHADIEFLKRFNAIVWSNYMEPADFEVEWKSLMIKYKYEEHD